MQKELQLGAQLASSTYPGRGILLGRSADNTCAVFAYFIMGRSENSRNRVFVPTADGIRTQPYEVSKVTDPSLILYAPVRQYRGTTIVTNGDQTDTIVSFLEQGKDYRQALLTRTFEPDAPNYTPRISGVLAENGDFCLSILKKEEHAEGTLRYFFEYTNPKAGQGRYLHTYQGDGSPLPSFSGEPVPVALSGDLETFTQTVWQNLNLENKVSLYTCFVNLQTGKRDWKIVNKHA